MPKTRRNAHDRGRKLHATLEQRLGESFKQVSIDWSRCIAAGEMQNLAVGVGDLKRVLTNVKSRGTWGEMQLAEFTGERLYAGSLRRERSNRTEQQRNG